MARINTRSSSNLINDENANPILRHKETQEDQQQQQQQLQHLQQQQTQPHVQRPRRVLGVISEATLNTRISTTTSHVNDSRRHLIPVLNEDDNAELQSHQDRISSQQKAVEVCEQEEEEEEQDDEEYEEGDTTTTPFEFEPMSPIMNETVANQIDNAYRKYSVNCLDPEDEDTFDVSMVAEYGNQIFNYLHVLENKFAPEAKYIELVQNELTWDHRSTLMNWLVQLHSRFNLLPETLFLTVNIIDRFLSLKAISLSRFQLCGAVAMFIASKYEEINIPTVSQMTYMVGDQFTVQEFLRAEKFMIEVLKFEFGWPGPMSFLRRGSKADDYDNEIRTVAKYFLEVALMDPRFVSSPPSWIAAGSQFSARRMLGRGDWTEAHVYYTGYTSIQLEPMAQVFEECCLNARSHHQAVFEKYSERKYKKSAIYVHDYLQTLYAEDN